MLPAANRLRAGRDIRDVARHGSRATREDIAVSAQRATAADVPLRAAVVVGRRCGAAVQRNRLCRRIRHALAAVVNDLPTGVNLVVRAGPKAQALSSAELQVAVWAATRLAVRRATPRPAATSGAVSR